MVEKTETEISTNKAIISGDISIGGGETEAMSVAVQTAMSLAKEYPNIHYHLFCGDAEAIMEKLNNGLLDFGIIIEPVDLSKYDRLHLATADTWGLLMRNDCPLATKAIIEPKDLETIPIIAPKRIGLQR